MPRPPVAGVPSELAAELGIVDGARVRVSQGGDSVVLPARVDPSLASNVSPRRRGPSAHGGARSDVRPPRDRLEPVAQDAGAVAAGAV